VLAAPGVISTHEGDLVMLTDLFPFLDPARIPPELPARLRQLAADLANLRRVQLRAFALREAPLLEHWAAVLAPGGVCLIGQASGHPVLGDRPSSPQSCMRPTPMADGCGPPRGSIGWGSLWMPTGANG
jgi:hypothetical protein